MLSSSKPYSPGKIIIIYVVLSGLWALILDPVIYLIVKDRSALVRLAILSDWFIVSVTALIFYALMRHSWQALRDSEKTLHNNYQALEATHEELVATEEQLEQQLAESKQQEEFYQSIYNGIADGVILQNAAGPILFANPAACYLLDASLDNMRQKTYVSGLAFFANEKGEPFCWQRHAVEVISENQPVKGTYILCRFGSVRRWLYLQSVIIENVQEGSSQVLTTIMDISIQKYNENKMTLLHGITQRIMAEQPLLDIYKYLCDELVNSVGYPAAFVGLKAPDGSVDFTAEAGMGDKYVKTVKIRWDDTLEGRGMVGEAIRSGEPQTCNVKGNLLLKQWWFFYDGLNLQSIAAFPLKAHGQILGVFALFSHIPDYFTPFHLNSLQTLAEQIAIAILTYEDRHQLKLQNTALAAAANAIVLTDRAGEIIWVNSSFTNLTGYSGKSVLGQDLRFLHSGYQDAAFYQQMWDTIAAGRIWRGELVNRRADGSFYHEEMTITPVRLDDTEISHFIAIKQDVSERHDFLKALRESEERYREMFENMRSAIAVLEASEDGKEFFVKAFNRVALEMERIAEGSASGQTLEKAFPVLISLGLLDHLQQAYATGKPVSFPATYCQHGNVSGWREGFIYKLSTGEVIVLYDDVTRRKLDEEALWLEKERAQITLASIGDAVITTSVDGRLTYLNPVAEKLTGWSNRQAEGLPLLRVFNIKNENTGQAVNNPVIQCIREKGVVSLANHTMLIHRDGHAFAIEDSAAPICDREGQVIGAVLVFHDVSDKRELIRQLFQQAHHDALTGLPNRLLFNDRAHQAIAQAHRRHDKVAMLFIDLDGFKLINDTLGHNTGDKLLRAAGERLSSCLRDGDTVARQGGDEFLILLPELKSESQAAYVAQKVLGVFEAPFELPEQEIYITASIGIALYPEDGQDVETLIKHADTAMYHTKDEGRNHYQFYTLALNNRLTERLTLQNDLRRALERQEFVLYYQPQYRLSDGQLCGMEALVRWQHPERGFLLPGEFISIAEDSGLILSLGEWVLREACIQNKKWQEAGYSPVRVAVNLSARQFRQVNLVSQIGRILHETGLEPQWLELEITESISMENLTFSLSMLKELKKMGIRLSMDDFGTGFSSLNYLSRFPLDTIKIDQSFIRSLSTRPDGQAIVTTIIQLAQNLSLRVIAEGVETKEQVEFLRHKRCDEVQGYYFARPVSEEAMISYFLSK